MAPQSQTARGESSPRSDDHTEGAPPPQPGAESSAAEPVIGKPARSNSDTTALRDVQNTATQNARPTTGGSFNTGRLPSRGSYGQPVAPTVAATNAEGRLAQPKSRQYSISGPIQQSSDDGQAQQPSKFEGARREVPKGHKRSSTLSGIGDKLFGRSGSISARAQPGGPRPRPGKRYPPTSMRDPAPGTDTRMSMDSPRGLQHASHRKYSESSGEGRHRRFSILPPSLSLRSFTGTGRPPSPVDSGVQQRPSTGPSRMPGRPTSYAAPDPMGRVSEGPSDEAIEEPAGQPQYDQQTKAYPSTSYSASAEHVPPNRSRHAAPNFYGDYNSTNDSLPPPSMQGGRHGRTGVLQKNRKFADAYEYERDFNHPSGSSGAARKVMDFFRRRAKARAGDER